VNIRGKRVAALDVARAAMQPMASSGHLRWVVCALIFFAGTINYVDRQVIGILKPTLQGQLGWNEIDYSNIIFTFHLAYAIGSLLMGRVMDWLGTRKGFSLIVLAWSVAAMAHSLARSLLGFSAARFALGLSESGNFPASVKTIAEWFPKKERALATGFMNAGTNVGAMITPLIVPWITYNYSWQWAFVATGALGFLWLVAWLAIYGPPESHSRVSGAELAYINSDQLEPTVKIAWAKLFSYRQTWACAVGKFMTDPIWWLYLFWAPDFLNKRQGVTLLGLGRPLVAIYVIADIGSIAGGWLSSTLIKGGWTVNAGRKTAMLICALAVVPIVFASKASHLWVAVGLVGLAAAAHQGWSANLWTMASDMFPRRAVGSVVGIGLMAGAVGGMLFAKVIGYVLEWTGSYLPVFIIAGSAYLIAFVVIQLLVPKLEPALVEAKQMG
jgi:MFS transporter, ACS family, aldohexuronate transporter